MDHSLFQYAILPVTTVRKDTNWLTRDISENYTQIDVLDFPTDLLNQVYNLYERSYDKYKSEIKQPLILEPYGLLKYNRWILFYSPDDPDKSIVSFSLFKTTDFGLKSGLVGTNSSVEMKKSLINFKIGSFNTPNCFGEISGRLEELILSEVPIVEYKVAVKILHFLGKADIDQVNDNHYSRVIGNLGKVTKIMVGLPDKSKL